MMKLTHWMILMKKNVIEILNNAENVEFSKAYFDLPCSKCKAGVEEKNEIF